MCHYYNTLNGSRLTGLTCSKAPGFWRVEHQLVDEVTSWPQLMSATPTHSNEYIYSSLTMVVWLIRFGSFAYRRLITSACPL